MGKTIKTIVSTLSILVILNTGVKIVNAENLNNQSRNTVTIENQIGNSTNDIDPDSKGK